MVLYLATVATVFLGEYLDSMGIKVLMLFLTDLFSLQVENILITKDEIYASSLVVLSLPAKIVWILLLFVLRRIW